MIPPPLLSAIGSFGGLAFLAWYLAHRIAYARALARSDRLLHETPASANLPPISRWHRYRCEDCGQVVAIMGVDGGACPVGKPL